MIDLQLLKLGVQYSRDGFVISDAQQPDNPLIYVNPAFVEMSGYKAEEVVGKNCRFLQRGETDQPGLDVLRLALKKNEPCLVRLRNYRKNGEMFWNELSVSPIFDADRKVTHFIGIQKEITAQVENELLLEQMKRDLEEANRELQWMADHDYLTGLFNRRRFENATHLVLPEIVAQAERVALYMVDIDYFKLYNDHYGHQEGDNCLKQVGQKLAELFSSDHCMLARYGGEEFVLLIRKIDTVAAAAAQGEMVVNSIAQMRIPHTASLIADFVTVSVGGTAVVPQNGMSLHALIKEADEALYAAKEAGRNCFIYRDAATI